MAIGYGVPCPKPQPRVRDRMAVKRDADKRGKAFRDAVWHRDGGRCRNCHRHCFRTMEHIPERGEVHHRRGRNVTPENRYNVNEAVLLCLGTIYLTPSIF